jgi:hypothetical protein
MEAICLCGPNTAVYDTLQQGCRQALVGPNSLYVTNSQGCDLADFIYAKSTSTVILKANGNSGTFRVIHEPGVTIVDQTNNAVIIPCNQVSFPQINCAVGLPETKFKEHKLSVTPNPAQDLIELDLKNCEGRLQLVDAAGELVIEQNVYGEEIHKVNVSVLSSGIYCIKFLSVKGSFAQGKLIISRL